MEKRTDKQLDLTRGSNFQKSRNIEYYTAENKKTRGRRDGGVDWSHNVGKMVRR